MKLTELKITNYRGIRELTLPLSPFGCLTGENNAGKSTVLQCLSLFFSGTPLSSQNNYDPRKPIRFELQLKEISSDDLARLASEHRGKIESIITDGALTLARCYDLTGKSKLLYCAESPIESRFDDEAVDALLEKQKPGADFAARLKDKFPELDASINLKTNQTQARELIQSFAATVPPEKRRKTDKPLPVGIDKAISPMLPTPIYIPAVKDLTDDTKTKETTSFGKVLAILLDQIEPELAQERELFANLNKKLNRVFSEDGTESEGERLAAISTIESTLQTHVQECFSKVKIRLSIPPPDLKSVLAGTQLFINDGVDGLIDTKGDGLKRAVVFSILRTYLTINAIDGRQDKTGRYLLLFEEPELYLHPKAQQILFNALGAFSKIHHVLVTTHSPMFFAPGPTATFTKLKKRQATSPDQRPYTVAYPVDVLSDMNARDQFQLINFDNNNIAFFADTVVLVEGESDLVVFQHIAKLLDEKWDCTRLPITFARIGGKGSFLKYKRFFEKFGTRTCIITDLDVIVSGFDKLTPTVKATAIRSELLQKIDAIASTEETTGISAGQLKKKLQRGDIQALWKTAKQTFDEHKIGAATLEQAVSALAAVFDIDRDNVRLKAMRCSLNSEVLNLKHKLLMELRSSDIFVLDKGVLEDYYPAEMLSAGKTTQAQNFCEFHSSRESVLKLCSLLPATDGNSHPEFEIIFGSVFHQSAEVNTD